MDVTNTTDVLMPMTANIKAETLRVEDPAFTFERTVSLKDDRRQIVIADHFVSLADEIAPGDVARYAANLRKARESLGYSLVWNDTPGGESVLSTGAFNWTLAGVLALVALLSLGFAWLVYGWDPAPLEATRRDAPAGLGGWLILPGLSLPLRFAFCVYAFKPIMVFLDAGTWNALTTPGESRYIPGFAFAVMFEGSAAVFSAAFLGVLMVLMLQRRTSVPRLLPLSIWLQVLILWGDRFLSIGMNGLKGVDFDTDIARSIGAGLVWTIYFAQSARVRATFTRRRKRRGLVEAGVRDEPMPAEA
jgi:hypothetical protein